MKVLVFPRDANPYQELLYTPMRTWGIAVEYLDGPTSSHTINVLLLPLMLMAKRLQGFGILHVHWTFTFVLPWAGNVGRMAMQFWAMSCWLLARLLGYQLIWTAHNVVPHERIFWNDIRAHRLLGNVAQKIIVHTIGAKQQLQAIGVNHGRIKYIPHGSYIGVYPDAISVGAARRRLALRADSTVVLFFGHIRPYKGIESLLAQWHKLPTGHNLTLLVAGSSHGNRLPQQLEKAAAKNTSIRLAIRHIPDNELQYYFRAANFTVLPYEKATTSGVALLAYSFGCPVIAPSHIAFDDLPATASIHYKSGELSEALMAADAISPAKRKRLSKAAHSFASELSWPRIAARTTDFMRSSYE